MPLLDFVNIKGKLFCDKIISGSITVFFFKKRTYRKIKSILILSKSNLYLQLCYINPYINFNVTKKKIQKMNREKVL